jgi:alkylation response protein AidB-like acyl-CoA dehydrogenase
MAHALADTPTDSDWSDLEQAATGIAALARDLAPESEADRRLSEPLVERLRDSGLLRSGAMASLGAHQAPPAVSLAAAETIARGDAAAGWCVSIAITSSLLAAYLPPAGAEECLGDARSVAVGVWAPRGQATPVAGGLRVSGRWPFCSGVTHADYFFAGCSMISPDSAEGPPIIRHVAIPTSELQIVDTWHTSGLRATGSHDSVAEDVFIPEHRVLSFADGPLIDAPLYRFPIYGYFALSIAAAALGNARAAIDDLLELAGVKTPLGATRTLAEKPATQSVLAQAEAALRAARALYYDAIDQVWQASQSPAPLATELRTGLRLAATHAVRTSAEVARAMYDLGGGTSIYDSSRLQRRFRDAHTATAHMQVNPATWELTGRLLLDLPTNTTQL